MEWYVYVDNINAKRIEKYNVFDHWRFNEEVSELLEKNLSRDEFSMEMHSIAMYYFWSKYEWEIIITSFPPYITKEELDGLKSEDCRCRYGVNLETEVKVDVYSQLELNWRRFVDYVWSFRE